MKIITTKKLIAESNKEFYDDSLKTEVTEIEIVNGVTQIAPHQFEDFTAAKTVIIPESVTEIGNYAFMNAGLVSLHLPSSLTKIGKKAFCLCSNLDKVNVPSSVQVAADAFIYTKVNKPHNLQTMKPSVQQPASKSPVQQPVAKPVQQQPKQEKSFTKSSSYPETDTISKKPPQPSKFIQPSDSNRPSLKPISPPNTYSQPQKSKQSDLEKPVNKHIDERSVSMRQQPQSEPAPVNFNKNKVKYSESLEDLMAEAEESEVNTPSITRKPELTNEQISQKYNEFDDSKLTDDDEDPGDEDYSENKNEDSREERILRISKPMAEPLNIDDDFQYDTIVFEGAITEIPDFACCNAPIRKIVIGGNVNTIGREAFFGCNELEIVELRAPIKTIGIKSFHACQGIRDIRLPDTVTTIGDFAFAYCTKLENCNFPKNLASVGKQAFLQCKSLNNVFFENASTTISNQSFAYCKSLQKLNLPLNLRVVPYGAFLSDENLTEITVNAEIIEERAFAGCVNLKKIRIPRQAEFQPEAFDGARKCQIERF